MYQSNNLKGEINMELTNIFQKGALIKLSTSVWTASKKINPNLLKEEAENKDQEVDPLYVKAQKFLVNKDNLRPIENIRAEARNYLYSKSLPFPIDGICFAPKDMITEIDERLLKLQEKFNEETDIFVNKYESCIEDAKIHLGKLFNITNYPKDIRSKFGFTWEYFILDVPNGEANIFSPEVYRREKDKFLRTIENFQYLAIDTLRTTFGDMLNHLVERLSGDNTFRASSVNKFREFMDDFKKLNINNDVELETIILKCQGVVTNELDPQALRDDQYFKEFISKKLGEVTQEFTENIIKKPIRKLVLD